MRYEKYKDTCSTSYILPWRHAYKQRGTVGYALMCFLNRSETNSIGTRKMALMASVAQLYCISLLSIYYHHSDLYDKFNTTISYMYIKITCM